MPSRIIKESITTSESLTITDGKDVCLTRNIGARAAGIVDEIADMKKALTGVTP